MCGWSLCDDAKSSCAHGAGEKPTTVSCTVTHFHFMETIEKNLEDIFLNYKQYINELDAEDR